MQVQKRINRLATKFVARNTLSRQTREHASLLQFVFPDGKSSQQTGLLHQQLKRVYRSSEKARYHRGSLIHRKLVREIDGKYYLTHYGASVLYSSGLRGLVKDKGIVVLDLRLLFELLDAEIEGRVSGLSVRELSLRLKVERHLLYSAKTRLASGKKKYVESKCDVLSPHLSKASETLYALTNDGRKACFHTISNFLANMIIREYKLPRWVSINEIMQRRWKYPRKVQILIENSFKNLFQTRLLQPSSLPKMTFFIFPWLEPIVIEYAITHCLRKETIDLNEASGFEIVPRYIFTGTDALNSFSKQKGARAILFALESLHLPEARFLRENSLLAGGIEGTTAYTIMGRGNNYKTAVYVNETVYSKKLVKSVAETQHIRESSMLPLDTQSDYLKVINKELEGNYIFHAKTPFGAIMKAQFAGVRELRREPITVGLFISKEDNSEIDAGKKLRDFTRLSLETLQNPRLYYAAVEEYVRKLPTLDSAFCHLPIVKKIEQSNREQKLAKDWREIFDLEQAR